MATYASLRDMQLNARQLLARASKTDDRHVVLTCHGKPVAVVMPVSPDELEGAERALRSWRLRQAAEELRAAARNTPRPAMTMAAVDREIRRARRACAQGAEKRHGRR